MKKAQKQESLHWGHRVTWLYSCYCDWWSFPSCILLRETFSEGTKTKFNPKPNTGTPIFNILCKGPKKRESRRSFVSSAKEGATCQILTYCIDDIKLRDGWPDQNCIFKVKLKSLTICVHYSRNRLVFEMYKDGFTWSKNKARVKASQIDFPREQIWSFKQVEAFCKYAKLLWNMSQKFSELLFNTHRSDRNFVATQFS